MAKIYYFKTVAINIAAVAVAVAIGVPLGSTLLNHFGASTPTFKMVSNSLPPPMAKLLFEDASQELIVLGNTQCQYCKQGVAFLEKQGTPFRLLNIDQDLRARKIFEELRLEGVPVLMSRNRFITGYNQAEWARFISSNSLAENK